MAHSVLIVEDETILAKNIQQYLEHHHYAVRVAATCRDGLRQFAEGKPDVLLLDVRLPDGNGNDVLRRVREIDPDVGVIIMTAFGGVQNAVQAMAAGADDYVEKPVPLPTLKLMIERLTGQGQAPTRIS